MSAVFAILDPMNWGVAEIAIAVVIVAAIVGLVYVALKQFDVPIPAWVAHVLWIVVVAFVVIAAIRVVSRM